MRYFAAQPGGSLDKKANKIFFIGVGIIAENKLWQFRIF